MTPTPPISDQKTQVKKLAISRFAFKDVTKPFEGARVYMNRYWVCMDGDPTQAAFFDEHYPQCNTNAGIINSSLALDGCTSVFIPVSFVRDRE